MGKVGSSTGRRRPSYCAKLYIFSGYLSMYVLRQVREFSLGVPLRDELVALPFQLV